ncbi:uncharacterized protein [Panulirus ornatus]|uniref:uncharacterized protein isoform X2 n=1 Tax=Panulirus ornatus TaxID=150431 RepID=UPI003A837725
MLKYVQVSPYRSSSALGGVRRVGEGCTSDDSTTLSSPSTPSTRMSSASSHASSTRMSSASSHASSTGSSSGGGTGRVVGRADSVSLNSSMSCSSLSQDPLSSRSSSSTSLQDTPKVVSTSSPTTTATITKTTVRVWVRCLMQEMEYKTVCITYTTTCRELVKSILSKFKMKHRDQNLFYLTMEVTVRKTGGVMRTTLTLEDDSRPAELQSCHPRGDSRLALKMRPGGLLRVYDGALVPGSQYKSLLVSEKTTCDELVRLVLLCNNIRDNVNNFSLYEVRRNDGRERKLHQDERPLRVTTRWTSKEHTCLVVRHTPAPAEAYITPLTTLRASIRHSSTKKINPSIKADTNQASTTSSSTTLSTSPMDIPSDNMVPSTTITISPNGASTVTINAQPINNNLDNNNYCKSSNNSEVTEGEESCPTPPLRSPRPIPPLRAAVRRQLPWTQSVDLVETPVDDEYENELNANVRTRRAHSYNDYENYFYI